jgi:hypothetical protein
VTTNMVEIQGTLQADGTLVLDEKPNLPPGRVRITVQLLTDLTQTPIWQVLETIWAEQRARGHVSRSKEEIDADIAASRQEDEERMLEIERLQEEGWKAREQLRKSEDS